MSTAYDLACRDCMVRIHFALDGVAGWRFGYSSSDSAGHKAIALFVEEHLKHCIRVHEAEDRELTGFIRLSEEIK